MNPVNCQIKHNPPETYGDCIRACVATILDLDSEDVPHFYHDNDGHAALGRMSDFLKPLHLTPFITHFDGEATRDEFFSIMSEINPNAVYVLIGSTGECDHAVVCRGGEVVWNPAWIPETIKGPSSNGLWSTITLARI